MKVLYDHQVFTWQDYGGISRYYYELIKAQHGSCELSLLHSNNEYIVADTGLSGEISRKPVIRRYSKLERLFKSKKSRRPKPVEEINQGHSIVRLNAGEYDLFHPTYYDRYFLDHIGNRPFVVTVYDMIHERFPEHFQISDPASPQKLELVRRATHVIAISENTKKDLIEFCGIDESRISVTYLGSSLQDSPVLADLTLPGRYLLMVGSRGAYKNCYFAIRALRDVLSRYSDLHIVFAGGGEFSAEELKFFSGMGLAGRVHHFSAADAVLRTLYSKAEAFIFPSLYEGFGIPTIEAFSCGCPVLSSNTPALREVAQDATLYFDPKSIQSIQEAALRIIEESGLREDLRKKGAARLTGFSWKTCAAQTIAIYENALGGSR
jgi:glycosyltransferase involved in cell wall biosynthesis